MVVWHVDDLKVSHIRSFEITKFSGYLSSIYGGIMLHRGEGICLFGNVPQIIQTRNSEDIYDKYLDSVLQEFPENLGTTAATPKTDHLFTVRDEGKKRYLLEDYSQIFHHTVSQLLFMSDI